jgi:hypothetical protein
VRIGIVISAIFSPSALAGFAKLSYPPNRRLCMKGRDQSAGCDADCQQREGQHDAHVGADRGAGAQAGGARADPGEDAGQENHGGEDEPDPKYVRHCAASLSKGEDSPPRRQRWRAVRTLIFTNLSLLWINVIGSVVFALLVPYVALGRTLLYFDLGARAEKAPAKRWRERLPRRTATAPAS